jgi:hypothetical protein
MAQRYEITESVSAVALVAIAGGVLVPGASATATIKDLSANNLTVYAAETGVTTATNPITTDAFGRIEGWVESPDYDIVVSGVTSYTQRVRQSPSAVFNVKSYGAKGDGTTNDTTAIQAALDAANSAGGGTVFCPPGRYKVTTALVPYSKVAIVGAGAGATIFAPSGGIHCFQRGGGVGTELTDIRFADFAIDGSAQTGLVKGIFCTYMKRARFERVYIHDTGASGFGVDFLIDTTFVSCVAENAGRNGTTSSPGCSGFGIGTGQYDVENVSLIGCTARGCKRYGVFFEQLGGSFNSKGAQVIGGRYETNNRGIGDNGSRGLIVTGANISSNTDAGFFNGADQSTNAGFDGLVTGCQINDNTGTGVTLDWSVGNQTGRYTVRGNRVRSNGTHGIKATASGSLPDLCIAANDCEASGGAGIVVTGGTWIDADIADNRCRANGQTNVSGQTSGVQFIGNATRPRIVDNHCWDDGGTQKQTYGVQLNSTFTFTNGEIRGNDVRNNLTGGFNNAGTLTGTVVKDNPGYNPVGLSAVTVTGSPMTYNAGSTPETLYVIAGTLNPISINGTNVYTGGANAGTIVLHLEPADAAVLTYTVAPTAIKTYKR